MNTPQTPSLEYPTDHKNPHYYTATIRVMPAWLAPYDGEGWFVQINNGDEWERASIDCYYLEHAHKLALVYVDAANSM